MAMRAMSGLAVASADSFDGDPSAAGFRNLAITPATNPMMIVQMIDINVPYG